MSSPAIFSPFSLLIIAVMVIISSTIIEGIAIVENHSVYASSSPASSTATLSSNFNFAAVGDWACTSDTTDTVNNIIDKSPELVLGLGDYSYEDTADCWLDIIQPIDNIMKISIGNHDDEQFLREYMNHFGLTKEYYSFDYQNVHFMH